MVNVDEILSSIYYDAPNPASFASKEKLFLEARRRIPWVTRDRVAEFMRDNLTYTLHHPRRVNFPRNPVVVSHVHEQHQLDLADMSEDRFVKRNDGYRFLLTGIDILSKQARVVPLKSKHANSVVEGLEKMYENWTIPTHIQTDRGKEFVNARVKEFMDQNKIHFFTSQNQTTKCAVVERFNRTIKDKIFRMVTSQGNERYIDALDDLVDSYNNSYHRTIRRKPVDVTTDNEREVFRTVYGAEDVRELRNRTKKGSKLRLGDTVRINYKNEVFARGYLPQWQDMVFKINNITEQAGNQLFFRIEDEKGRTIPQRFYSYELQKISPTPKFRIEKVLKRRTRNGIKEGYVKYVNHPSEFNEWIPLNRVAPVSR